MVTFPFVKKLANAADPIPKNVTLGLLLMYQMRSVIAELLARAMLLRM